MGGASSLGNRSRRWPTALVWVGVLGYWLYAFRTPIWSFDDLNFATRDGTPGGRVLWSNIGHWITYDVGERNGRTADIAMQWLMGARPLVGPVMALSTAGLSWAIWLILRLVVDEVDDLPVRRVLSRVALAAAIGAPFTLLVMDPSLAGNVIFFMAANMGYVFGGALMLVAVRLVWSLRDGGPWWAWVLAAVLGCFVGIHHELLATSVAGACVGFALVTRRQQWRIGWALLLAGLVSVSLLRFTAGGLWQRSLRLRPPFPLEGEPAFALRTRAYTAYAMTENLHRAPLVFVALGLGIVCLGAAGCRVGLYRRALASLLALGVVLCAVLWLAAGRLAQRWQAGPSGQPSIELLTSPGGTVVVWLTGALTVLGALVVWLVREHPAARMALPTLGVGLGPAAMAIVMGNAYGRTMYLGLLLLLVAAVQLVLAAVAITERPAESPVSVVAALVVAAAVGPALQGAPALLSAVDRNIAVWERVEHQLVEIREGRRTVLELPANLPEPDYSADYVRDRAAGHRRLLQYYGLPENTVVVVVPR